MIIDIILGREFYRGSSTHQSSSVHYNADENYNGKEAGGYDENKRSSAGGTRGEIVNGTANERKHKTEKK